MPGFQSFFSVFLHHLLLDKLATSCIRVKMMNRMVEMNMMMIMMMRMRKT